MPNRINFFTYFIFISFLFTQTLQSQSDSLAIYASTCNCSFYDELETNFQCGKKGYPLNYGKKFCLKFSSKKALFSEEGKIWLDSTMTCLMQNLADIDLNSSCKALAKEAFDSHIPCYIENGYCELSKKDRKLVYKIAIPSLIFRPRAWKQGAKVLRECRK